MFGQVGGGMLEAPLHRADDFREQGEGILRDMPEARPGAILT